MAHNKLRRDIETHMGALYGTLDENALASHRLLERVLSALGGPVVDNRPAVETVVGDVTAATALANVGAIAGALVAVAGADVFEGVIIGDDPGDETSRP